MRKKKYKVIQYKSGRFGVRTRYSLFGRYDSHNRFETEERAREYIEACKFYDLDHEVDKVYD